jgi:hypothetical protein
MYNYDFECIVLFVPAQLHHIGRRRREKFFISPSTKLDCSSQTQPELPPEGCHDGHERSSRRDISMSLAMAPVLNHAGYVVTVICAYFRGKTRNQ